jgi:predicted nuclease of restriction endonuclease-like (RecB) superfamily
VEYEQKGTKRAGYGEELIARLSSDLTSRFGRGFGPVNLSQMRKLFLGWPFERIFQTAPEKSLAGQDNIEKVQTVSEELQAMSVQFTLKDIANRFPLPWSHYVRLLSVQNLEGRVFYEKEALRGGWSVRQLDRQINSQFYERTAISRNKAAMLKKGSIPLPEDTLTPEEEIKDPFVLEFLGLKDEYSESDLEDALIRQLENFLLELGGDFTFVGRQRRLRVGNEWYRVDLLFFHRRLRCLVIIDLKLGKFTHADAGQMHLYLNYAQEHWTHPGENPPVGLILCAQKDHEVARYALESLPNKVLAAEYKTVLPHEKILAEELKRTRRMFEVGSVMRGK